MKYEDMFNRRQKNEIIRLAGQNTQITAGFTASPLIRDFARKNEGILDPKFFRLFMALSR